MPVQIHLFSSPFFAHILFFSFSSGLDLQVEGLIDIIEAVPDRVLFLPLLSGHNLMPGEYGAIVYTH